MGELCPNFSWWLSRRRSDVLQVEVLLSESISLLLRVVEAPLSASLLWFDIFAWQMKPRLAFAISSIVGAPGILSHLVVVGC